MELFRAIVNKQRLRRPINKYILLAPSPGPGLCFLPLRSTTKDSRMNQDEALQVVSCCHLSEVVLKIKIVPVCISCQTPKENIMATENKGKVHYF